MNIDRMLSIFKGVKLSDWWANQVIGVMIGHLVAGIGLNFLPGAQQLYALQSSNLYCVLPFSNMDGWLRQLLNISTLLFFFGVMSVLVCSIVFFPLFEISQPS
jgi:hypothetical protein